MVLIAHISLRAGNKRGSCTCASWLIHLSVLVNFTRPLVGWSYLEVPIETSASLWLRHLFMNLVLYFLTHLLLDSWMNWWIYPLIYFENNSSNRNKVDYQRSERKKKFKLGNSEWKLLMEYEKTVSIFFHKSFPRERNHETTQEYNVAYIKTVKRANYNIWTRSTHVGLGMLFRILVISHCYCFCYY